MIVGYYKNYLYTTDIRSAFKKKKKESQYMVSHPETGSDSPIGSDRDQGRDKVSLVKVLWQHHGIEDATWEPEATMRAQHLQLFISGNNFEDKILLRGREL